MNLFSSFSPRVLRVYQMVLAEEEVVAQVEAAVLAAPAEPAQEQAHLAEVEPGVPALEAVGVEEAPAGGGGGGNGNFFSFSKNPSSSFLVLCLFCFFSSVILPPSFGAPQGIFSAKSWNDVNRIPQKNKLRQALLPPSGKKRLAKLYQDVII